MVPLQIRADTFPPLQCDAENTSDYFLLGPSSVFLDESYVSKTNIPEVAISDTFEWIPPSEFPTSLISPPSSFVEQWTTTTTTYISTTKLSNQHTGNYLVNIVARSSIPVASENDPRIKVFLKGSKGGKTGSGSSRGGTWRIRRTDRKKESSRGMGRSLQMARAGKVVLVGEWDVRAPIDTEWMVPVTG